MFSLASIFDLDVRCGDLGATTMETASLDMMMAGVQQREKEESLKIISTFMYRDSRELCREDQRGVGAIQGFEAPELEVAGDLGVRG